MSASTRSFVWVALAFIAAALTTFLVAASGPAPQLSTLAAAGSPQPLSEEVFVPAGPFSMGCAVDNSYGLCDDDARPIHTVYLDAFYIDRTEVTNAQYRACEMAGACPHPLADGSATRPHYYTDPAYNDYPVINVDWNRANAYCHWVGKRLPTEAEWEKAARGTDLRWFPWGNEPVSCERANYRTGTYPHEHPCVGDTAPVGSYPLNVSPYGALDMVGNVSEWVADLYDKPYYNESPYYNPRGPESTDKNEHLVRGGSWENNWRQVTVYVRLDEADIYKYKRIGFRCARSAPGPAPTPTPTPTPFATTAVGPEGGALWLADGGHLAVLEVPSGTLSRTTTFTLSPRYLSGVQGDLSGVGYVNIEAEHPLTQPMRLFLGVEEQPPCIAGSLAVYRRTAEGWTTASFTTLSRGTNYIEAEITTTGLFGLLGNSYRAYLPVLLRQP